MFGQDGYTVREFRGFNFVYHPLENQKGTKFTPRLRRGVRILARPKSGGKLAVFAPIYLTSVRAVAENDGLFVGSGKSPRLNQIGLSTSSKGTLVAEVFA